jgi:DNA polymerase-4
MALGQGSDDRVVVPYEPPKSVSNEETFGTDIDDEEVLLRELLALSHKVAARLRKGGYQARTISLKARLASFTTLTRSRTLSDPTDVASEINAVVRELFRALPGERNRFRLLGVATTGLLPAGEQQLAMLREGRWSDVERAMDRIESRFGRDSTMPAALLDRHRHDPSPQDGP